MVKQFEVLTKNRYEMIDVTEKVSEIVAEGGLANGLVFIFAPHSTAGILLTENEPGLIQDWLEIFKKLVVGIRYQHNQIDNNADSHILSGLIGQGKVLAIENGRLVRGAWQNIFLAEFDGPQARKVIISNN